MPWGYAAAAVASTVAGDALSGLSGGTNSQNPGNVYQPTGTSSIDSQLQALLSQNSSLTTGANNPYNAYNPQILQAFQTLFNSPQATGLQNSANAAGTASTGVGNNSVNLSQLLSSVAPQTLSAGQQVLNMGLDPQNALFNQQQQLVTDQSNVANAQNGLTGQQAAGNTSQNLSNFDINWQNNELSRALQGLTGYTGATSNVGTTGTAAQNTGAAGVGSIASGGALPYAANTTIGTQQQSSLQSLLANLLGPANSSQNTIGNLQSYLGEAVNAGSAGANAAATNAATNNAQAASLSNLFGSLFNTQATPVPAGGQTNGINNSALDF